MGERGPKCTGLLRRKMFLEANNWLRSTNVSVRYRYNRSMAWLLSPSGFLRGPVRQLYTEYADNAVPSLHVATLASQFSQKSARGARSGPLVALS